MLGALLALASAAMFGMNNAAVRRGVLTGSVLQAMLIMLKQTTETTRAR